MPISICVAVFTFVVLQVLHKLLPATGADFRAMLRGAHDVSLGRNLYSPALKFLADGHLRSILQMPVTLYVYPPPLAILLRPLNSIPTSVALTLWDAINVSLLAYIFGRIVRISRAESFKDLLLIGTVYGFYPMNMGLGMGQVDILLMLMGFTSYLSFRRGHCGRAGLLLGCMALVKPTLAVLLLFFLARKAFPILISFTLTLFVGAMISIAAVGVHTLWEYRTVAVGWSEQFGVLPLNQSLHGLVLRVLSPRLDAAPAGTATWIATGLEGLVFLLAALLVLRLLRNGEPVRERDGALQFYAAFSILLLGQPFTENLHFAWMIPGFGLLFVVVARERGWSRWHAILTCAYLCLASPLAEAICWGASASWLGRIASGSECYCIMAISLVFCRQAFGRRALFGRQSDREILATQRENAA